MIRTKLMQHQREIVDFCKDKDFAGIFAEYGTGKTLCMLKLAEEMKWSKILVVCSKTAILATWPSELSLHTDFIYTYLTGTKANRINALSYGLTKARVPESYYAREFQRPVFFLINYDGVKSIYNELVASDFDAIIVDESTKIKYPNTLRTKVMWALGKSIPKRFILTGFPITESPQDLYSQVKFLDRGFTFGNSYYGFMDKYFAKIGFKYVPKKNATKDIIKAIEPFCIRKTNESLNLPPKRYFKMDIEPSDEQKRFLGDLKKFMQLEVGKVNISTEYIFTLITKSLEICDGFVKDNWYEVISDERDLETHKRFRKITCKKCQYTETYEKLPIRCPSCRHEGFYELIKTNKDDTLIDLLEEVDAQHHKVLIWTPFKFTVKKLGKLLDHHGYKTLALTGETDDVKGVVDKFMVSKTHNILILTEKKASESLNLTNCNIAIYYSNEWSYDRRANSEARIYRKGSEKHAHVIYVDFITKGSIEGLVYACLTKKKDLVTELKNLFGGHNDGITDNDMS